jgi:UDP-2,3-diacylglucosamine pyrophosphatase LpxH
MLARSLIKLYAPRAEIKALYRDKLPGIISRLRAAELIARNIGLIKKDVFSFTSGLFIWEYRRNLSAMKLISHALVKLERDGWIKVFPSKIYYVEEKAVTGTDYTERHRVFEALSETIKEIATMSEGQFASVSAQKIQELCKDIFKPVADLSLANKYERERKKPFFERHDFSPITKGAAMDIAASGYFYERNKEAFDKPASSFVIRTGDQFVDSQREIEAGRFDQYTENHVRNARELSGQKLREDLSLERADVSTLFPGDKKAKFFADIDRLFAPDGRDRTEYLKFISSFLPKENPAALEKVLDLLIDVCKSKFIQKLSGQNLDLLTSEELSDILARAKVDLAEIMGAFMEGETAKKIPVYLQYLAKEGKDGAIAKHLELLLKRGIEGVGQEIYGPLFEGILPKTGEPSEYDITYVISDLHLQDFVHRDIYELLRLIHMVVKTEGTLVINGDFLDSWRAKNLVLIIKHNKLLFDSLRKLKRLVIIKGNHDGWLELFRGQKVFGENISVVERLWMPGLHIEHGNAYDVYNSKTSRIGEAVTKVFNKFEENKTIGPQLLAWVEYLGKRFQSKRMWTQSKVGRVISGIEQVYSLRDPDGATYSEANPLRVVFGHFHFPGLDEAYRKIMTELTKEGSKLAGKVKFFLTDSWYNSEGYAGEVVMFAKKKTEGTEQVITKTMIWDYIDGKSILTLYGPGRF